MRILLVSPCFAPDLQVGALRMTSLAAYLLSRGERLTVLRDLRPENPPYAPPEGMTVRCVDLQALYPTVPGAQAKKRRKNRESAAAKLYLAAMREEMRKARYDLLLISMGPFYTQALVRAAKREFGVPCVLDFRDPGALDRRKQVGLKNILWFKVYRARMFVREWGAVRAAARVVTVVPGWARLYEKTYRLKPGKVAVVENGFDDEKLAGVALSEGGQAPGKDALTVACFGKLTYYSREYATRFFQAAAALVGMGYDVRVLHLGQREGDVSEVMRRAGFPEERYENVPFCPYLEGMARLRGAQALLAVDERPAAMATKVYDYIFVNRPALFMGPKETEQARLIGALPGGYACQTAEDAQNALLAICEARVTRLLPDARVSAYGRSAQNEMYHKLLTAAARK